MSVGEIGISWEDQVANISDITFMNLQPNMITMSCKTCDKPSTSDNTSMNLQTFNTITMSCKTYDQPNTSDNTFMNLQTFNMISMRCKTCDKPSTSDQPYIIKIVFTPSFPLVSECRQHLNTARYMVDTQDAHVIHARKDTSLTQD